MGFRVGFRVFALGFEVQGRLQNTRNPASWLLPMPFLVCRPYVPVPVPSTRQRIRRELLSKPLIGFRAFCVSGVWRYDCCLHPLELLQTLKP